jgi:hypothetical protein
VSDRDSNRPSPHVIVDDLPSLLFRQRLPGGHAVVDVTLGDVPKELTVTCPLGLAAGQRGYVSRAFSRWAMAGRAIEFKRRLALGSVLARVRIFIGPGRSRSVVKVLILRQSCGAQQNRLGASTSRARPREIACSCSSRCQPPTIS